MSMSRRDFFRRAAPLVAVADVAPALVLLAEEREPEPKPPHILGYMNVYAKGDKYRVAHYSE